MDDVRDQHESTPATHSLSSVERAAEKVADKNQSPLWLALDQGGHASRALVFDHRGKQVAQAYAPITTQRQDERVEHDAREILDSLRIVVADIALSLGNDVQRIKAAGLATQRSSIVCWHASTGIPLSPVISWQDTRNRVLVDSLQNHREQIQEITGLVLSPHYGASKLRWCLDEIAEVKIALQNRQLLCGPLASYLSHGLLEEHPHVVDPANASRTQLWSPATGEWSPQLLQWFGIPKDVLPQPVATHHRYGTLRVGKQTVPLQICTGDQAAVPFAMGKLQTDTIYLNAGTGAFMLAPLSKDLNAAPLLRSVLYSDATQIHFALEGTVNGAGSALHWFGERSAIDVDRALPLLQRGTIKQPVPLFINGIGGIGSPYWLPNVKSEFVDADQDERLMLVAVIESVAFLIADNVVLMRTHLPDLKQILAGGGLSACEYLCECVATLTGLPVMRVEESELTAKGLAWLVAEQPINWHDMNESASYVPTGDDALVARYQRWKRYIQSFQTTIL
ncbi:MAG TPA: FGGY family carbohydrate kinase [Steroidobacteraceae bacterium]|nr:FGGY family carbohydrate kinase [Steroidobacteraceae bacterium]